jgi:hypothetical protein
MLSGGSSSDRTYFRSYRILKTSSQSPSFWMKAVTSKTSDNVTKRCHTLLTCLLRTETYRLKQISDVQEQP